MDRDLVNRILQARAANPSIRQAASPTPQPVDHGPDSNPFNQFLNGAADFGKTIVSGVQQAAGDVADVGLQAGAVANHVGNSLNPFLTQQQRDQSDQRQLSATEATRNAIHGFNDVSGNKIAGTSGADQAAGKIASGHGNVQDFTTVAGQGLQTGLDATMFFNPGRLAGKAIIENPGAKAAAKDIIGSSLGLGGVQGLATGALTFGKTGDLNQAVTQGLQSGAESSVVQGVLGGAAHGAGLLFNKLSGPARTIARSDNPTVINKTLTKTNPELDDITRQAIANELANIKDQKTVKAILGELNRPKEEIPVEKAIERGVGKQTEQPTQVNPVEPTDNGTALSRKQAVAAAKQAETDATLASAKDPNSIDYPTFQAQRDFEAFAQDKQKQLDEVINSNPDLTPQQIEAVKQAAQDEIKKTFDDMQAKRQASMDQAQNVPAAAPNDKSVEQAAQVQTGTAPAQVQGDGSTVSKAPQGDLPQEVGANPAKASEVVQKLQDAPADGNNVSAAHAGETGSITVPGTDVLPTPTNHEDIVNLTKALESAQTSVDTKGKKVSQEKAQRIAAGNAAYEAAGGGEAGVRAKMAQFSGKYSQSDYTPISVDTETQTKFLDAIHSSPNLQEWEKFNTQNALRKVWGANPEKPVQSDINYIRRFFNDTYGPGTGDELAKNIEDAIKAGGQSYEDVVANIAGLPRALMATGDLSGGFRQAMPLGTRFPKIWANANKESVKYALNPKYYDTEMQKIADSPEWSTVTDKLGVDLPGVAGVKDEGFIGAGYAENIPIGGHAVKAADRAYTGVLTRMRYDVAKQLLDKAGGAEKYVKDMENLYGDTKVSKRLFGEKNIGKSDRAMRTLGEVINSFTGRGGLKGGPLDTHMKTASSLLFAPRLWAANLARLNPLWYARLARDNPQAAKLAAQAQGTFFLTAGTVLGLAASAGAVVGIDPRSSDFGKIKVGNTRYDILGGQQQNLVFLSRLITGEKVNSETGAVQNLGSTFGGSTALSLAEDMFQNKSNPLLGFGMRLMQTTEGANGDQINRKDQYGKDFNLPIEIAKLLTPLGIQGAIDTSIDTGSAITGSLMNAPSFFGVGVQTYGTTPTKDTVAGGSQDAVAQAKAIDAQTKIDQTTFKNGLNKQDQAFITKSETDLQSLVDKGVIDQNYMDGILQKKADYGAIGNTDKNAQSVKDPMSKQVYGQYDKLSSKDQEAWLKSTTVDDTGKQIASTVNQDRAKGLDEFKPSNALSKLYADYQKTLSTTKDLTEIDKVNEAKKFQSAAAKLNYGQTVRDLYTEGGSDDTKTLLSDGKLSQDDLNKAIELDNQLYTSGVTSSLKFSKKFRGSFGFGTPEDPTPSGSGGSSGSAHLSSFLTASATKGNTSSVPSFSAKTRTQKGAKALSLPKTPAPRKLRIRL